MILMQNIAFFLNEQLEFRVTFYSDVGSVFTHTWGWEGILFDANLWVKYGTARIGSGLSDPGATHTQKLVS